MSVKYDFEKLKSAISILSSENLPTDEKDLDKEIQTLVDSANSTGEPIRHYIGFEISGQIHLATGLYLMHRIKLLQDAGVKCTIWLADYHTWLNRKLDGKIETARAVAKNYFGPVLLECCRLLGADPDQIDLLFADKQYEIKRNGQNFFTFDLQISRELTLARVLKSITIMGKAEGESVEFGTLRYPPMQVADAFFLNAHIVHAGTDQRKAHVLMREVGPKLSSEFQLSLGDKKITKPIAIHEKLIQGLATPSNGDKMTRMEANVSEENKMSKSKPDSAIWVHDSEEEIYRKLKKAYCPMIQAEKSLEENIAQQTWNPILNWCENLIFPIWKSLDIYQGETKTTFHSYQDIYNFYLSGALHPLDFKQSVAKCLVEKLAPIRNFVEKNPDGLALVKSVRK